MAIITSKSFDNQHLVEFNDKPNTKVRYKLDGTPVVGVTTFTKGGLPTSNGLVNWKIEKGAEWVWEYVRLDERPSKKQIIDEAKKAWELESEKAAGIGVIVHNYAQLVEENKHEEALEMLAEHEGTDQWNQILNATSKFDEWKKQNKDEILYLETIVGSPQYQFAGRFDRLVSRNGLIVLSDYKTSSGFYVDQFIQDGAYAIAIKEWLNIEVQGFEVIRFSKDSGEFQTLLLDDPLELALFKRQALRCLSTYNFMKVWNKDKRFKYGGTR